MFLLALSMFSLFSYSKNETEKINDDVTDTRENDTSAKIIPNDPWNFLTEYSAVYQVYY